MVSIQERQVLRLQKLMVKFEQYPYSCYIRPVGWGGRGGFGGADAPPHSWNCKEKSTLSRELVKPGTRNEEMGNDGNGKRGICNSKHSATELAMMMKSQAYRLAVVLQPLL